MTYLLLIFDNEAVDEEPNLLLFHVAQCGQSIVLRKQDLSILEVTVKRGSFLTSFRSLSSLSASSFTLRSRPAACIKTGLESVWADRRKKYKLHPTPQGRCIVATAWILLK